MLAPILATTYHIISQALSAIQPLDMHSGDTSNNNAHATMKSSAITNDDSTSGRTSSSARSMVPTGNADADDPRTLSANEIIRRRVEAKTKRYFKHVAKPMPGAFTKII